MLDRNRDEPVLAAGEGVQYRREELAEEASALLKNAQEGRISGDLFVIEAIDFAYTLLDQTWATEFPSAKVAELRRVLAQLEERHTARQDARRQ